MTVTYQIGPIIEAVRAFIDSQMTSMGSEVSVLPTIDELMQYPFTASLCPLMILEPVTTTSDWRNFAAGDVTLTLDLNVHEIRIRSGASAGEESAAVHLLSELGAAFTLNYRLGGDVQNALVESILLAEPTTLHRLGIPSSEFALFAAATMKLKITWVESCFSDP